MTGRKDECKCGGLKYKGTKQCAKCRSGETVTQDSTVVKGDHAEITATTTERVRTLADLVRVCAIDESEWEIVAWTCKASQQASVPRATRPTADKKWTRPSTEPVLVQMFHVSATLKRKVAVVDARAEIEALKADARRQFRPAIIASVPSADACHMLHLDTPDLHVGKLAWAPETGHESYDTKIAEQVFEDAITALIDRTKGFKFKQVIIPIGNDLLNADNKANATTRGTVQDSDSRYQKSFGIVRRMMTRTIDRLREIAPVTALMIPGNHDTLAVWHLGDSLECFFHGTPDVTIDNAPTSRKYHQFGKVMLMFTHGDKGKRNDYPLLMATERPQMFGETTHREAHTGHLHTMRVQEHHGVRVRISPALCPPDAWHAEQGYVGNARAAQAFVWHETDGLVSLATYTVPTLASKSRKRAA